MIAFPKCTKSLHKMDSAQYAAGQPTTVDYSVHAPIDVTALVRTTFGYDANGNTVEVREQRVTGLEGAVSEVVKTSQGDGFDRLTERVEHGETVSRGYDVAGNGEDYLRRSRQ